MVIEAVDFLDRDKKIKTVFKRGEPFEVRVRFYSDKLIQRPEFAFEFFTDNGVPLSCPTTRDHGMIIDKTQGYGEIVYHLDALPLNVGRYMLTAGIWDSSGLIAYDHHEKLYQLAVERRKYRGQDT